jgi:anti-sigma-K factor RskA
MNDLHADMLDDVALYALGTLPEDQARVVRNHIAECAQCRSEYEALAPAATAVALSAQACSDPVSGSVVASPLLKARIMREVRRDYQKRHAATAWPAYAVAAAAIAIAIGLGATTLSLRGQLAAANQQLAAAQRQVVKTAPAETVNDVALRDILDERSKRYPVTGGEIVRAHNRLYIAMHEMPAPPRGKVYQAWTLAKGAKGMSPAQTFVPDKRGVAIVPLNVDASKTQAVAVSVEPPGGSKAPTTSPVLVESLE